MNAALPDGMTVELDLVPKQQIKRRVRGKSKKVKKAKKVMQVKEVKPVKQVKERKDGAKMETINQQQRVIKFMLDEIEKDKNKYKYSTRTRKSKQLSF